MTEPDPWRDLFDIQHTLAASFLEKARYPWEILPTIGAILERLVPTLPSDFLEVKPGVWIGSGTDIAHTAYIVGPAIIGRNCQIRHGAFIREYVLIGDGVIVGNASEIKNAILFDGVQAPHFNYIGDSILGYKAHLGAGAILSNFKAAGDEITVRLSDRVQIPSGLTKLGGLLGDFADIGCNAVVFPGTIIGRGSRVYPLTPARGHIPPGHILKSDGKCYPMRDKA
jgi:NDP-sugar pyrophosphorylase family protein